MEQADKTMGTTGGTTHGDGRSKSRRFEEVKNVVADRLHSAAGALRDAVGGSPESESNIGHYGYQASQWLDESAEYVRRFDYEQTDAKVREYVRQNPGRSLLMAGAAGVVLGALLRRR